jgi:hypothetical protein
MRDAPQIEFSPPSTWRWIPGILARRYYNWRRSGAPGSPLGIESLKRWPARSFTHQVLELLLSQPIEVDIGNTKCYVVIQDVELGDNPLAEEVAIRFRAEPNPPPQSHVIFWEPAPSPEKSEVQESTDASRYQLLVFTFSSSFELSRNKEHLHEFTQEMVSDRKGVEPWFRPAMVLTDANERTLRQVTIVAELAGYHVFQARTHWELKTLLEQRASSVHCIFINAGEFTYPELSGIRTLLKVYPEKKTIVAMWAGAKLAEPLSGTGTLMLNIPFSDEQLRLAISRAFAPDLKAGTQESALEVPQVDDAANHRQGSTNPLGI